MKKEPKLTDTHAQSEICEHAHTHVRTHLHVFQQRGKVSMIRAGEVAVNVFAVDDASKAA